MKPEKIIKSQIKLLSILIPILGGIVMISLGIYLAVTSLESEYPQIVMLILGVFFGLVGVGSFISLFFLEILYLDRNKLTVKSIFGYPKKFIYISEIVSYNEIEKETKSSRWKDLTIYTAKSKYKISSSIISNYHDFKRILTKGKERNIYSEQQWAYKTNRNFGIGFIVFGFLFLLGMLKIYHNRDTEILKSELTTIKGVITNKVEIERAAKGSRFIHIKMAEFPEFIFQLSGNNFNASDYNNYLSNVETGDALELDILTDDYEKKLTKTKPLTFFDKTVNYDFISIYGLRDDQHTYLSLEDFNLEYREDSTSWGFWLFVILSIGITSSGVYLLIKNKKPAANKLHM